MSPKENPPAQRPAEVISSEERLTNLLNGTSLSCEYLTPIPKIRRIQPYLRDRTEFSKFYNPKLLSVGPIHHGHENFKLGERYKHKWTRAYFGDPGIDDSDTRAAAQQRRRKIASNLQDLKKWYSEDAVKKYKDEDLVWMLFVDGCSVLHIINNAGDNWGTEAASKLKIKIDQLFVVLQDMLLLENQLPYELLRLLTDDTHKLEESMLKFLQNHNMLEKCNSTSQSNNKNPPESTDVITIESPPDHLLGLLHKTLLEPSPSLPRQRSWANLLDSCLKTFRKNTESVNNQQRDSQSGGSTHSYRIRNIQELKAAGIKVKKSKKKSLESLKFKSYWLAGRLELPEIIVDDFTAPTLMNLIAYEMSPGFPSNFEISSYVAFLDLLIDHPDDVKELRSAGVLQNHLGNDEEVAKLFNTISTDLIVDVSKYAVAKNKIEKHCSGRCNTWMAQVYYDHFSSPWTIIAFLTVVIVTGLTIVQTRFTIWPRSS